MRRRRVPPPPDVAAALADALWAACHPRGAPRPSVLSMELVPTLALAADGAAFELAAAPPLAWAEGDVGDVVVRMFEEHAGSLMRMARLFVDDRNAAEDLVQEAFIRLSRTAHRIAQPERAASYLRSIVLNLARDHNRRGLVSLRHHLPLDEDRASAEDHVVLRDDQRRMLDTLRDLPVRQRDCLVLRYYLELGIPDIADTLGISPNSVKTHLQRGLDALGRRLGVAP